GLLHEPASVRGIAALEGVLRLGQQALDVAARRQSPSETDKLCGSVGSPAGESTQRSAVELDRGSLIGTGRREREVARALFEIRNHSRETRVEATPFRRGRLVVRHEG